jgi:hypothetical protein
MVEIKHYVYSKNTLKDPMTMHEVRRFEDLKGVSIQAIAFWDVMPYTLVHRYQLFG